MLKKILLFICLFICLMLKSLSAQQLTVMGKVEAVSTDCTDDTQVFSVRKWDLGSPSIYILKDDALVYSEEKNDNFDSIFSFDCLKHAIIINGVGGTSLRKSAIISSKNNIQVVAINKERWGDSKIKTSQKETIVDLYGDERDHLENKIVQHKVFQDNFLVPKKNAKNPISLKPIYYQVNNKQKPAIITAQSKCYSVGSGFESFDMGIVAYYTTIPEFYFYGEVISDTDEDKLGAIDVSISSEEVYTYPLPFVVTNSMCIEGETYLFGKKDKALQAAKLSYSAEEKKFIITAIDPKEAPLQPYLK